MDSVDASVFAAPIPGAGPPSSPEEYRNRVDSWVKFLSDPGVQEQIHRMGMAQGLFTFGTRLMQNIGSGQPLLAKLGNAAEAGMWAYGDTRGQYLQNALNIAKGQAEEDDQWGRRALQSQQLSEQARHNKVQEGLQSRYYDIMSQKIGGGGGGAGSPSGVVLDQKTRDAMWKDALDGCNGDFNCAKVALAMRLLGTMSKEEAMALFPVLRPESSPQVPPGEQKPAGSGFINRIREGLTDWTSRNVIEPLMTPKPKPEAQPTPIIPEGMRIAPPPLAPKSLLQSPKDLGFGQKTLMDIILEAKARGELPRLTLEQLTEMQRRGLATLEQVRMYIDMLNAQKGTEKPQGAR